VTLTLTLDRVKITDHASAHIRSRSTHTLNSIQIGKKTFLLTDGRKYRYVVPIKMFHGRFVHIGKTLTDLQILGCELHQNAFGGRAPPGTAEGSIALPKTPSRY